MNTPQISVILPAYNAEKYVGEAVDSILAQTFGDFELLIIDDGSTDGTPVMVNAYTDPRIRVIRNPRNVGLAKSLNIGIRESVGEFIARQDGDDLSLPTRLGKQIAYLGAHPKVGVVGTNRQTMDEKGGIKKHKPMPAEVDIGNLEEGNRIIHGSVMMRATTLNQVGGYDEWFKINEDYDLWMRMVGVTHIDNLPDSLYILRQHSESMTAKDPRPAELYRMAVLQNRFGKLTAEMRAKVEQYGILVYEKYLSPKETFAYTRYLAAAYKKQGMNALAVEQYRRLAEMQLKTQDKVRWNVRRNIWFAKWKLG